ncbi:MAG: DNA internalization-related competence protein ComEC/Rec2 [Candidatus Tumulicola sp.]
MPPYALVLCSSAAVLGTLAATGHTLPLDARVTIAAGFAALAAFACAGSRERQFRALVVGALVAAALNAGIRSNVQPHVVERRTAAYAGTILERSASELTIGLADNGLHVLANVRENAPPLGSHVVVRGRLTPFDGARNPGEPSEQAIQRERGNAARLEAATILSSAPGSPWDSTTWLARAHEWAHRRLTADLGEPTASVVAGELWGERSSLPPDLRSEFQETGTVHVLVTAGLHLGAVVAVTLAFLSLFALPRAATCAIAVAVMWIFVWWSGAQLPAVRAASMATAALAARACGRATLSWNALAIAALVLSFARPQSVASASFALSFSCVGAIFACAGPFERWIASHAALPARVREALVLAMATQCGTWPLTAAVFLQFAPYALVANLAIVPCVAATMALGCAQLALFWLPPLAHAAANANSWLLAWMLGVIQTLASLPYASIPMTPAPAWCILWYDAALVAAPLLLRRGARTAAAAALAAATGFVILPPGLADGRLRVTVLDVGQADAIVVQTPAGHAVLVDAGGRLERGNPGSDSIAESIGERIVAPFLLRSGIHRLDAVIVSHPHGDHAGGVAPVLRHLRVAELADSGQRYGGHAYRDAIMTARAQSVPLVYPRAGSAWRFDDGVTLQFIGPSLPFVANSRNDINENSVAFILRYKTFCMLFTGDAGAAAEQRFLSEGVDLRCAVLKIGHHGSAYSSTPAFIEAVHPTYAVISVGRHNLFGHPALQTLQTMQRFGASVYRTDENGAITVLTDGSGTVVFPRLARGLIDSAQ